MSGLIEQIQDRGGTSNEQPRVLNIDDGETDDVLDALSSDTGRLLLRSLYERPGTPSEIAARCDTSVQNIHYHITNMEEAGLIEQIDTIYSEKGNEMTVYGPASDPIVLVGDGELQPQVQRSLTDIAAGLGLLGLASLLVQWGAENLLQPRMSGVLGPASPNASPTDPTGTLAVLVFTVFEPGLLFFCGCLAVIGLVALLSSR
ncbi:MAG: ArsR/SmtB family transcription factor [Haloarcula sp.]